MVVNGSIESGAHQAKVQLVDLFLSKNSENFGSKYSIESTMTFNIQTKQ